MTPFFRNSSFLLAGTLTLPLVASCAAQTPIVSSPIQKNVVAKTATPIAKKSATATTPTPVAKGVQARKADDFVDSIGVCLHVQNYNDEQWKTIKAQLGSLGVRYYRDGLEHVDYAPYRARYQDLYDTFGMKILAVTGPMGNDNLQPRDGSLSHVVDKIASIKPMLLAVEGPNEPEYFWYEGWKYGGFSDRPSQVVWYQNLLYDAVKKDARTKDVLVTSFALARQETSYNWFDKTRPLIKHDIVAWHHYNGRYLPNPNDSINSPRTYYSSKKPAYLTEHGYRIRGDGNVTQLGQMKLDTRSMAYFFDWNDNLKTFFYVAGVDTAGGEDYGLDNQDYTPRPVFNSMKGVLDILKEATWNSSTRSWKYPAFKPGKLDYTVSGESGEYGWRLLQKSNGDFYLIALPYINVANSSDGSDAQNRPRTVTLSFAQSQKVTQLRVDDKGNYRATALTDGARSVSFGAPDTLMIFKISRGAPITNSTNRVTNPGFELDNSATQTPSGWLESGNDADSSFVESGKTESGKATTDKAATKAHGGKFFNTQRAATGAYSIYTYQNKTGLENGRYTLRAWAKSSGGQKQCYLEAKDFGGTAKTADLPVSNIWTKVEIKDIDVSNGQCTIGVWSNANAGNWCSFDDFELVKQ